MSTDIKNLKLIEDSDNFSGGLLLLGEKINGYTITKKLNTNSGEAELYFCEKSGKQYILKYYYKKTIFSDLAEKLMSLKHSNVMNILDVGEYKKHSYEVNEWYEGGSLDAELPLKEEKANKIFEQINNGLKAIHDAGIIHRDIKAENIFFKDASKNEIVIGDFGIATLYDQKDDVNEHLTKIDSGTDGYKAPESFNGVISPAIDYYSLGITVWNILTGKTPFIEESGEIFSSGKIRYETIEDKVKDYLLDNAQNLSEKSRKLISGLLIYLHDKRWGYENVKDFLSGKDVKIIEERRELPAFLFGNKELFTLKSIAEELLKDKKQGIEIIKGSQLTRYLDKNDLANISDKIGKIQDEYLSDSVKNKNFDSLLGGILDDDEREEYALIKVSFAVCNNITFPLTYFETTYNINTLADFIDLLLNHPMAIRPYLLNESYGLYEKLKAITDSEGEESLAELVKRYTAKSTNARTLPISLYLELNGNKISPFKDKLNANIVLENKEDVDKLDSHLKERLMYLIDSKNKLLVAWFENVYKINMDDWYNELEGGPNHDEDVAQLRRNKILAFGKWSYFNLFLKRKDVILRKSFVNNGKYGLLNLDGSVLWDAQFDDVHCIFVRDNFIFKVGNTWRVYSRENSDEGKYESILQSPDELSVLNESDNIYKTESKNENDFLYIKYKDKNEFIPLISQNTAIGNLTAYSEILHPNERFINEVKNHFELLDNTFNKIKVVDKLQAITAAGDVPKELTFWAEDGYRVKIIDKKGNILQELPYTSFYYVGNNHFIVKDIEGRQKVVNYKGDIIQDNVNNYRSSGRIATIKRSYKSKWELLNLNDSNWKYNGKKFKNVGYFGQSIFVLNNDKKIIFFVENKDDIVTTNMILKGKGGIIQNSNGLKKTFVSLNINTAKKAYAPDNQNNYYNLLGFDGTDFYKYSFSTNSFEEIESKKYVYSDEFNDLMDDIEPKDVINLVKNHIKNKKYESANKIINITWEYYYEKQDFETVRYLLSSIRMDKMEGLDMYYLYYKNRLGYTYMKENENLKDLFTDKDMFKKNQNYIHSLHYLLSAAGKEINEKGEIVTAPYFAKLELTPQLLLDCAEVCISISKVEQMLYLGYGWTKEYIQSVAFEIMQSLFQIFTDENTINSETYLNINKLGSLFVSMGDVENALTVFKIGIKYEPDFAPINEVQVFNLLYHTNQYEEALSIYQHLEKISPDINKSPMVALYEECKRRVGL